MTQTELNNHPLYLAGIPPEQVELWEHKWEEIRRAVPDAPKQAYYDAVIRSILGEVEIRLAPDPIVEAMRKQLNWVGDGSCTDSFMRQYGSHG